MKIGVIGTGYVGLVTGTCLAHLGHHVTGYDIDSTKIENLKNAMVPIFEPGLSEMMKPLIHKNLFFSDHIDSLKEVDAVFIAVGTPSSSSGAADLKYVFSAVENASKVIKQNAIIIMKSTVPVGTAEQVKSYIQSINRPDLKVVSNPEFLKEGAAIKDFLEPDRIVVGADHHFAFEVLEKIYQPLEKNCHSKKYQFLKMSNVSAELTKYAANCFLAAKISFMNEMAHLCEASGANIEDIKLGIGSDPRVGSLFLNPGPGYGGSCFPKDVKALIHTAEQLGVKLEVVNAAEHANEKAKNYAVTKLEKICENLQHKTIAVWGLSFKAQTDDVRESSAISVCRSLMAKKVKKIQVFDPEGMKNFMKEFGSENHSLHACQDQYSTLEGADALIILTEWSDFKNADITKIKNTLGNKPILDMRNLFSPEVMKNNNMKYYSLGRN
jgi:UDPglucose 6-dehydrogenase